MELQGFVQKLRGILSKDSYILTDENESMFKAASERWSNLNLQTPGVVVMPAHETDVICTVKEALKASIPFVPASGGHSNWSTIGKKGLILDLSRYKAAVVDTSTNTVIIKGGLLMKELQVALSREGRFTVVSNGSTVGCIPFLINGGLNVYYPLIGSGCELIVSAKVLTASGEVVEASEKSNPELLWAIRGAGQFFGVVIELTVKTFPFSMLGNPEGARQMGTYIFLPHQAADVCRVMEKIIVDNSHISWGQIMITAAPSDPKKQVLLVTRQSLGSIEQSAKAFEPLVDLGPIQNIQTTSTFETHSDHLDWTCVHQDFKRYDQLGTDTFQAENFLKSFDLHSKLMVECPGTEKSFLTLMWHSERQHPQAVDTAFGYSDTKFWFAAFSWYTDASQHEKIAQFNGEAMAQMRLGTEESAFISFTNITRDDPIEYRYKGQERLARLKALKKEWDPEGIFTRQLL